MSGQMTSTQPYSIRLAEACRHVSSAPIDPTVVSRAKELLLDFCGVMIGGLHEEPSARVAVQYSRKASSSHANAESSAFAMATTGHSLELDDVHNGSSLHPGVVVIPAALAVAEEVQPTTRAFLESVLAGYEVMLRVGEAAGPAPLYRRLFHPTAVCGVFGAAAAAGRLMGLDSNGLAHAFGIAWGFASGNMSFQAEGSWLKRIQVGHAAQAGVQAARLAALGAKGPLHVFESHGFFENYAGHFEGSKLLPAPGDPPKLLEVSIKPHACCRYNQAAVDLALEFRAEGLSLGEIQSIHVQIPSAGLPLVGVPIEGKRNPADQVEAQFSLPHSVAVAFVASAAGHLQYRDPWLKDERVCGLRGKVTCGSSPEIDALYPAQWAARMTVTLNDGSTREKFTTACKGDPAKPLSREAMEEKFLSLTRFAINTAKARQWIETIRALDRQSDLSPLLSLTRDQFQ